MINLKKADYNLNKSILIIYKENGQKDREIVTTKNLNKLIQKYHSEYNPIFWFFES